MLFLTATLLMAQEVRPVRWSGGLNLPDPTSVTLDEAGNVYVACTSRRKAADLDIREHSAWVADDLALTSPEEKLAFLRKELAPGRLRTPRGGLKDHNGDGSIDLKDLEEVKERIYRLTDVDGDGVADRMTLFAEGFNEPNAGIAAGVLWHDGWIYVTAIPHLWRLKDTDGDGRADVKEKLVSGFGAHIAYAGHDMHGLRLGPDGRIWWSIGDKGLNVTSKEGRKFVYPHEGAVLRCEPDGSGFEVFAHGLRNVQEIAFDENGDVFGVDNDGDAPRERERAVFVTEGSDSGWRNQHQYQKAASRWLLENVWMPQGQPDQPLSVIPPVANFSDGPAGFLREPGHALDGSLRGHFMLNQFPKGRMDAFRMVPDRDGFRLEGARTVSSGIMGIGMSWGPDGRAYFADWDGGYPLDGKGAVWRFEVASRTDGSSVEWLSKPLSESVPVERCLTMLAHRDQRVRINASIRLDKAGAWKEMLTLALDPGSDRLARMHAIWGWGMGLRKGRVSTTAGLPLLELADDELRAQALKVLSEAAEPDEALRRAVQAMLSSSSVRVRMHAALASARLGGSASLSEFVLDPDGDFERPWLRHALVSGIAACVSESALVEAAVSSDEHLAVFATLALARRKSPSLALAMGSPHDAVIAEAARAIHDDEGVPAALPALAAALNRHILPRQAARRALNACLRLGTQEEAARLVRWLRNNPNKEDLVSEALQCMLVFDEPPRLDRVDGVARSYPARDKAAISRTFSQARDILLGQGRPELRTLAFSVLLRHRIEVPGDALLSFSKDRSAPASVRIDAIRMLAEKSPGEGVRAAAQACDEGNPTELRIAAFDVLVRADPETAFDVGGRMLKSRSSKPREKQAVIGAAGRSAAAGARQIFKAAVEAFVSGKIEPYLRLEIIEAAADSGDDALKSRLAAHLASSRDGKAPDGTPYAVLAEGGDAQLGRKIVNEHLNANCVGCHRVESDDGSEVGPRLRGLTNTRSRVELVESLVAPSARISPGFGLAVYQLKDGRTVTGTVVSEKNGVLMLRSADGTDLKLGGAEIVSTTPTPSIMPPMLGILNAREIRDVVAYLSELKPRSPTKRR